MKLQVPHGFTNASGSYRLQAWAAMLGLLVFLIIYLGLAFWFSYTVYRLVIGIFAGGDGAVACFFSMIPPLFLAVFMWKALFSLGEKSSDPGVEVFEKDQPKLCAYINELADEIGAPRPYRIFLAPNVTAAVFYDLSFWNLIFPSKKNLIIGLGLVNALNRSEFRAVLAHEFGHFAQRSMAVGRWVYVGQQIAGSIIAKRDFLDRGLAYLSSHDLRIAWIGWIMQMVVWSIRSLMETLFGWVIRAQRALSRAMEFQADRVAVATTGSDAIVNALYRLQSAERHWDLSLLFAQRQCSEGHIAPDLYDVQTRIGEHMQRIIPDESGVNPSIPVGNPAAHRIFTEQLAQPPTMWATHPSNIAREENAKEVYIPAPIDSESPWTLFEELKTTRESVTKFVLQPAHDSDKLKLATSEDSLNAVDHDYELEFLNPRYQGAYLYERKLTTVAESALGFLGDLPARDELSDRLSQIYPDTVRSNVVQVQKLQEEIDLLKGIKDGTFEATNNQIRHRGEVVSKHQILDVIEKIEKERAAAVAELERHDQFCHSTYFVAARYVAHGWQDYLKSVFEVLHFAEHALAEMDDARSHLANLTHVTVAGRASEKSIGNVIKSANVLHGVMNSLYKSRGECVFPVRVQEDKEVKRWLEDTKFDLPRADRGNIGSWLDVIDSWANDFRGMFTAMRESCLEELLRSEEVVGALYLNGGEPPMAPKVAVVPSDFPKRVRGTERKRKDFTWWGKLKTSDRKSFRVARSAVAFAGVSAVVMAGAFVGSSDVVIYNGLGTSVMVEINGDEPVRLNPKRHKTVSIGTTRSSHIETRTMDGQLIEAFEEDTQAGYSSFIYNVAGGASMVEWTMVYGDARGEEPRYLGYPRFRATTVDHIFEDAPRTVKIDGTGTTRTVLETFCDSSPEYGAQHAKDKDGFLSTLRAHAMWDDAESKYLSRWLRLAAGLPDFDAVAKHRLAKIPNEVPTLRIVQDLARANKDETLLAQHRAFAESHSNDPSMRYLAVRAMPQGKEQDQAFIDLYERWPDNGWVCHGTAFAMTSQDRWEEALRCFETAAKEDVHSDSNICSSARIKRYLGKDDAEVFKDARRSEELSSYRDLESGASYRNTPELAYSLIHQGKLVEAARVARGKGGIVALIGCSEGATKAAQELALDCDPEEIYSEFIVIYLAALAAKNKVDPSPYLKRLESLAPSRPIVKLTKELLDSGVTDAFKERVRGDALFIDRTVVMTAAVLLHPDDVPSRWRKYGERLLFAGERPYIAAKDDN